MPFVWNMSFNLFVLIRRVSQDILTKFAYIFFPLNILIDAIYNVKVWKIVIHLVPRFHPPHTRRDVYNIITAQWALHSHCHMISTAIWIETMESSPQASIISGTCKGDLKASKECATIDTNIYGISNFWWKLTCKGYAPHQLLHICALSNFGHSPTSSLKALPTTQSKPFFLHLRLRFLKGSKRPYWS